MDALGNKTGGRQKGTPNRAKQALLAAIQDKFPEYHPVLAMAEIANDGELPIDLRFSAHKEIAQYVEPKRKAIEGSLTVDGAMEITHIERHIVKPTNSNG
jgi:hypothetical protein